MSSFGWGHFWINQRESLYAIMKIATGYLALQLHRVYHLKPTDAILDYGCGLGAIPDALAAKNVSVTGVDINDYFLQECRKNHPDSTFFHITTDVAANKKILDEQLQGKKFDYIILSSVVQYLKSTGELEAIIQMLQTHLNEQGRIIVADVIDEKTSSYKDALALFFHCIKTGKIVVYFKFMFYLVFSHYRKIAGSTKMLMVPEQAVRQIAENNSLNYEKRDKLTLHPTRRNYILSKKSIANLLIVLLDFNIDCVLF